MKVSRTSVLGLLLVCACSYEGVRLIDARTDARKDQERLAAMAVAAAKAAAAAKISSERQFVDVALERAVPKNYPRPESDWENNEKAFYQKILTESKFDTLLVPFQVMGWSFDRSTRSLMTAELALAIAQTQKANIPDPYLVAKALGDGQRQLKQEDVYRLADSIGAKRIIWGYAAHDRKGQMAVTIVTQDQAQATGNIGKWGGPKVSKNFVNLAFTDEIPPIEVYESLLPELLKAIGLDTTQPVFSQVTSELDLPKLPISPGGLSMAADNPARDAYAFLLYQSLTPELVERAKERFAEKALLALLRLSKTSPEFKALRARSYMALGYRLAAIKTLDIPQTEEEKEILAVLNGNLPEVRAIAAREKNPLKRLIEKLDANRIGSAYGLYNQKDSLENVQALNLPGDIWLFVTARAFVDGDQWSQFDNAGLKMLLDYELPIKGYSLKEMVQGSLALGDPSKIQAIIDLSVFNHGRKFIEQDMGKWSRQFSFNHPGSLDYLELLQSIGHSNLMQRVQFQSAVQGNPSRAIAIANSIQAVYNGYPYYSVVRASVERQLAQGAGGVEKDGLLKAAYANAFNAMYWEQSQSYIADFGRKLLEYDGRQDYGTYGNFYYTDIPYRPYYWTWADGTLQSSVDNRVAALKNSTYEIETLKEMVAHYRLFFPNEPRASDLLKSIDGRFIGSPERNKLFAKDALLNGDAKSTESLYRDNVKLSSKHWDAYQDLADFLFRRGLVTESQKAFLSYPGFKNDIGENRVGVANYAFAAGSYFYGSGYPELAKPLYAISAAQRTGAGSEMTSSLRLNLLAGDINGAMAGSLAIAQRYKNNRRYEDYLAMLHASGQSNDAWAAFAVLVQGGQGAEILDSALVGHHKSAQTETEVINWAQQSGLKGAGRQLDAAASYLLKFATTDRTPSKEAIEAIHSLGLPRFKTDGLPNIVYRQTPELPLGPKEHRVKGTLAYFAEGYRALKLKDFGAAKSVFDEAATIDELTEARTVAPRLFFLPYYAIAAVEVKDTSGIEKLLDSVKVDERGFHYYLARAVLEGGAGENAKALQSLHIARCYRPNLEEWPLLPQYTYGEISEWIAEKTGSAKVRELAIDWAKNYQKTQPWQSWSYALEAKLTKNSLDRKRAIAMTQYLDPRSERLSAFKKSEIDDAVKVFGKSNPFTRHSSETGIKGDV